MLELESDNDWKFKKCDIAGFKDARKGEDNLWDVGDLLKLEKARRHFT